jgi:hypothetical protein
VSKKADTVYTTTKPLLIDNSRKVKATVPINKDLSKANSNEINNILEIIDFRKIVIGLLQELGVLDLVSEVQRQNKITEIVDDDPMEIDLVMLENAKELACVDGQIEGVNIQTLIDPCSNISIMREEECEEFGFEIDVTKRYNLVGVSTKYKSLGTVKNISVTLKPESVVIKEDFAIVGNYPHREIILSRPCLRRYNYDLHESREHVAITCDGKNFFIPIVPDRNRSKKEDSSI